MNYEYGSSGSFGAIVGSKSILHYTYTCRRNILRSKPTPIHVTVNK